MLKINIAGTVLEESNLNKLMRIYRYIQGLIFVLVLIATASCDDKEETIKYQGTIVLSSEKIQEGDIYIVYGYSFEKGKSVPFTLVSSSKPDIIVSNITDVMNNIIGAVMNSPDNEEAFYLNTTGSSYSEAKEWFDNYSEVTATNFKAISDSLELYQVWTLQTAAGKYAKLLIREINNITGVSSEDYIDITVDFEYQPDGTKIFRTNRSGS
jgi:hypothetical protein